MAIVITSVILGAIGFLLYWYLRKDTINIPKQSGTHCYEVFGRSNKLKALDASTAFNWWMGLTFAALFYWSLPLLMVRYGALRGIAFIGVPMGISFGITFAVGEFILPMSFESKFWFGFAILLYLRTYVGIRIANNDSLYRGKAMLARKWKSIGLFDALSKNQALKLARESLGHVL